VADPNTTKWTEFDTRRLELIWELDEAVRQIARMKVSPDDKVNRITLVSAIRIAREVLGG